MTLPIKNRLFKKTKRIYLTRIKEHRNATSQLAEVTIRIVSDDNKPCLSEDIYFALVEKQTALTLLVDALSFEISIYKQIVENENV